MASPRSRAPSGRHNAQALKGSLSGNEELRLEQLAEHKTVWPRTRSSTASCHWSQLLLYIYLNAN